MTTTISITNKWQIHIPKSIREDLGLIAPGKLRVTTVNKTIVLKPYTSKVLQSAGKYHNYLKKAKKVSIDRIRDAIDYS